MKNREISDRPRSKSIELDESKNMHRTNQIDKYINNRVANRKKQFRYWRLNWRSGLIRLLERILIGANISDRLGGDYSQFANSTELSQQVIETHVLNKPILLDEISVRPLGSSKSVRLTGVARERRVIRFSDVNVDSYTGLIKTDMGLVIDSTFPNSNKLLYMGGLSDAYASANGKVKDLRGTWAVLPYSEYFYHTLIEEIASLLAIREVDRNFKVLVFEDAPRWTLELLTTLRFDFTITKESGSQNA
jgi:hypothetical protein